MSSQKLAKTHTRSVRAQAGILVGLGDRLSLHALMFGIRQDDTGTLLYSYSLLAGNPSLSVVQSAEIAYL